MRILLTTTFCTLLVLACDRPAARQDSGSDLSTLSFVLPEGAGKLYNGYFVGFSRWGASKTNANCSPEKSWAKETKQRAVAIAHKVKNGCDYLIVLNLGKINNAGSSLDKVYYTNKGSQPGTIVRSAQLTGGTVDIRIKLSKTKDAPPSGPNDLDTRGTTDLKVKVVFDEGPRGRVPPLPTAVPATPTPRPAVPTPAPTMTDFQRRIQSVHLTTHVGQNSSLGSLLTGKQYVLVRLTYVGCPPCAMLNNSIKRDANFQRLANNGKCRFLTAVLPNGGLGSYASEAASIYQHPAQLSRTFGLGFTGGFPYVALVNAQSGAIVRQSGGYDQSIIDQFKNLCGG